MTFEEGGKHGVLPRHGIPSKGLYFPQEHVEIGSMLLTRDITVNKS